MSATPKTVQQLIKLGYDIVVEQGAGANASFPDTAYEEAGATIVDTAAAWGADIVFGVNQPTPEQVKGLRRGAHLITFLAPRQNEQLTQELAAQGVTAMSMDMVPRISRAQSLDALSSMANISGYRAVVEAAHSFGRFFNGQVTAAGKVPPAKVFVIGTGVAGLAALGAANGLGAQTFATDMRPETAEQVVSMGGTFLKVEDPNAEVSTDGYAKEASDDYSARAAKLYTEKLPEMDVVVTTAAIPGRRSPLLITADMVKTMKPGSVIVDMAAAGGGNCELTRPGESFVTDNGVTIIGYTDLPSRLPAQSSQLYGTNLVNLMKLLTPAKDGNLVLDFEDEVQRSVTTVRDGEITFPPPQVKVSAVPVAAAAKEVVVATPKPPAKWYSAFIKIAVALLVLMGVLSLANLTFLAHISVFLLAVVIGFYVVWGVNHALHTPLMSVTNAISGIIVVGGILQLPSPNPVVQTLAFIATTVAFINIFGGFAVSQRMLNMFRKD